MSNLENKIDFIMTFEVCGANPNGDPLGGNMPRTDYRGFGEVSDVCIKRKIRNRWQDMGHSIFVQANERIEDEFRSLEKRFESQIKKTEKDPEAAKKSCELWMDVRSFGQVMTFQKRSLGIRGPVSISMGKSIAPINIETLQITRSTNGMEKDEGRSSDTMGTKHFINHGIYVVKGSINVFFAEKTGFSMEDAEALKEALRTLFVNDASSARPEGSMEVKELFWFIHDSKVGQVSSAKIHQLLEWKSLSEDGVYEDYGIHINEEKWREFEAQGIKMEKILGL